MLSSFEFPIPLSARAFKIVRQTSQIRIILLVIVISISSRPSAGPATPRGMLRRLDYSFGPLFSLAVQPFRFTQRRCLRAVNFAVRISSPTAAQSSPSRTTSGTTPRWRRSAQQALRIGASGPVRAFPCAVTVLAYKLQTNLKSVWEHLAPALAHAGFPPFRLVSGWGVSLLRLQFLRERPATAFSHLR